MNKFLLEAAKSIVFHSPNQIWLRCYSVNVSCHYISPIYNKGALFYGCAYCCVLICPKERVSTSRLVATSTYILYLIANYRYTDNHGHLRTLQDKFLPKFKQRFLFISLRLFRRVTPNHFISIFCCIVEYKLIT